MKKLTLAIGTLLLAFGASAGAATPKKKAAAPGATPAPGKGAPKPEVPKGPAGADAFVGDIDESPEWFQKNDLRITQLKELIQSMPDSDSKATRMIQLAEFYWEKASRLHMKAVKVFNKEYDAWFMNEGAKKGIPEPTMKGKDTAADAEMNRAIQIYEYVIRKYPNNSRSDEAHYYLGMSYLGLAKKDEAVVAFHKLVENYPQSSFIPDAYLQLGEFFYDNKQLPDAETNYTKAASYPQYKNRAYALYKRSWVRMNERNCQGAIDDLKHVVAIGAQEEGQGHTMEYKEQALNDLVRDYTECGQVDEAVSYLSGVGGPTYVRKVLELFGDTFFGQGRDDEAIGVYKKLLALDPMYHKNLTYEGEILKALIRKATDRNAILAQLDHIVQMVSPDSEWVQKNQAESQAIQEQRDSLENAVAKYAREVFEESKKLSADQSFTGYKQAERFCTYYLQTFSKAKNAYPMRMMLAETQYKLGHHSMAQQDAKYRADKLKAAMDNYIQVVEANPKGEFINSASEGAIYSSDDLLALVGRKDYHPAQGDYAQKELPGEEALVIKACDVYLKYNPRGAKTKETRFKAANIFYNYNQFDEAVKRFTEIINIQPGTDQARFAADLVLDIFGSIKKDPATTNQYARNFLKIPELCHQKFTDEKTGKTMEYRLELEDKVERSGFQMIGDLEQKSKFLEAAAGYMAFAREFPSSDLTQTCYYNASVDYEKGGQVDKAIAAREDFIHRYPNSPHTPDIIAYLGDNYRKTINFAKAADYYEELAIKYKDYKSSADSLYNAALFRENLGELPKAIEDYRLYLKQYPGKPENCEIVFTIADIYETKVKNKVEAVKGYEEYLHTCGQKGTPDLVLESKGRMASMTYEEGKKTEAYAKYKDLLTSYHEMLNRKAKLGPTGVGAAAKAGYFLVEPKFEEYKALKLETPALDAKIETARKDFLAAIASGKAHEASAKKAEEAKNVKEVQKYNNLMLRDEADTAKALKKAKAIADDTKVLIKKKLAMLKELADEYQKVADYRFGDWTVAAFYQQGRLSEEFMNAVKDAPLPPTVNTDEEKELYQLDLQEIFGKVEEASVGKYNECLDASYQNRIYNDYTRKSLEGLARLRPSQYTVKDPEIRLAAGTSTAAFESSPIIEVK